jgi:hypothetical protein
MQNNWYDQDDDGEELVRLPKPKKEKQQKQKFDDHDYADNKQPKKKKFVRPQLDDESW